MPNNLDMGGFGSPGLPVQSNLRGTPRVNTADSAPTLLDIYSGAQRRAYLTRLGSVFIGLAGYDIASVYATIYSDAAFPGVNFRVANGNTGGITLRDGSGFQLTSGFGGTQYIYAGYAAGSAHSYRWTDNASAGSGTADLYLWRHAAGVLIQRNGTNAQQSILSRSWTDNSNYSWYRTAWNTSTLLMMAEGAGTGTDGSVAFNDAVLSTSATVGFLMIPSCAGTPSGTPADIPTGQIPLVWDSTNLKLYAYTGGAWKASAAFT